MKKKIHHHVGAAIIRDQTDNFLFQIYDNTYPKIIYRGRISFIGGNHQKTDNSPLDLLTREIKEEFSTEQSQNPNFDEDLVEIMGKGPGAPQIENFAREQDITLIRNSLLNNIKPYNDFFVTVPGYAKKLEHSVIYSVYEIRLPQEIFDCARENICVHKSIINEGFLRVTSTGELVSGKLLAAAGSAPILQHYLKKPVPNSEIVTLQCIGTPRRSLKDYLTEFIYKIPVN